MNTGSPDEEGVQQQASLLKQQVGETQQHQRKRLRDNNTDPSLIVARLSKKQRPSNEAPAAVGDGSALALTTRVPSSAPAANLGSIVCSATCTPPRCFLLESRLEIVRTVYSFLTLQERLVLRRTCRQLHNDNYDAFQYSHLYPWDWKFNWNLCASERKARANYESKQNQTIHRNLTVDKLEALLHSETFRKGHQLPIFLQYLVILQDATDNAEVVTRLLKDSIFQGEDVDDSYECCYILDTALQRGFNGIVTVALLQHKKFQAVSQTCAICATNIGCYECINGADTNDYKCLNLPKPKEEQSLQDPKYCLSCAQTAKRFCRCGQYVCCPQCFSKNNYERCQCGNFLCNNDDEQCCMEHCLNEEWIAGYAEIVRTFSQVRHCHGTILARSASNATMTRWMTVVKNHQAVAR